MNLIDELGPELSGIEILRKMLATGRRPGMADTLDIRLVEVEEGRVVMEATADVKVYNPMGIAHGGFAATVLDFVSGYVVLSKLAAGQSFSTLEIKVAYHRPLTTSVGAIRAEGKIVSMGRRAAFTEGSLRDAAGKLYATATSSLLLMPRSDKR